MSAGEFDFIKRIVSCMSDIQLRLVEDSPAGTEKFIAELTRNIIRDVDGAEDFRKMIKALQPGRVYELQSIFDIQFALVKDPEKKQFLVVGPCLTESFSQKKLQEQINRQGIEKKIALRIQEYCRALPEISYDVFHELSSTLASGYMGIEEPVPYERVKQQDDFDLKRQLVLEENYDELSRMRHIERRYEFSTAMTEAVKEGNLTLAYSFLRQMRPASNEIVRNPNPLRNAQNLCIVANTQLRHAMEESGIHPYTLDKLSSEIAMKIEKLRSQKEANNYSLEIIRRYCELAQEPKVAHLKPFSRLTVTYIKAHLSDNLSVKSTAQALVVNANYLSSQFHKEVGMTFTEYVNRERVKQAAALLRRTNLPINHIATSVGYNNTSYFAKQFAKYKGMSPGSYRSYKTPVIKPENA